MKKIALMGLLLFSLPTCAMVQRCKEALVDDLNSAINRSDFRLVHHLLNNREYDVTKFQEYKTTAKNALTARKNGLYRINVPTVIDAVNGFLYFVVGAFTGALTYVNAEDLPNGMGTAAGGASGLCLMQSFKYLYSSMRFRSQEHAFTRAVTIRELINEVENKHLLETAIKTENSIDGESSSSDESGQSESYANV